MERAERDDDMSRTIHILLQTTIEPIANDWHIGRFSMLRDYLSSLMNADGSPLFHVTTRDRDPIETADSMLSTLDQTNFDELWLTQAMASTQTTWRGYCDFGSAAADS
jgi:hypothetical protein